MKKSNRKNTTDNNIEMESEFVNPYYFVPLGTSCTKKKYEEYKAEPKIDVGKNSEIDTDKNITGFIECELKTLTPTFIPNTSNENVLGIKTNNNIVKKQYEFYSYEDLSNIEKVEGPPEKPVIPGSEIRGMIRSEFEVLTNSCMSSIGEGVILHKRYSRASKDAGILKLEGGKWFIIQCTTEEIPKDDKRLKSLKEGERISTRDGGKGFIHFSEHFPKKENQSIFIPKPDAKLIKIEKDVVERYYENLKVYRENCKQDDDDNESTQASKSIYGENGKYTLSEHKDLNGYGCYYFKKNNIYYLSPAQVGREIYKNSIKDIIGTYKPCEKLDEICPACSLFGFVKDKNALSSKIRFTDAEFRKGENNKATDVDFVESGILKELASPKIGCTEFYLKTPRAGLNPPTNHYWNYDYAEDNRNQIIQNYTPTISGRKFYWHHNPLNDFYVEQGKYSKRNVAVRPIKPDRTFAFKVYFDNISITQLSKLILVLTIFNYQGYAHKIGMGKPLGLGSIEILVKSLKISEISLDNNDITYGIKDFDDLLNDIKNIEIEDNALNAHENYDWLVNCLNFEDPPTPIEYPSVIGKSESFHWFVQNRTTPPGSRFNHKFYYYLPEIERFDPDSEQRGKGMRLRKKFP